MTNKQKYLKALVAQPTNWIEASVSKPSQRMTKTHIALHLIELRRRGRIASYYADVAQDEGWQ